MYRIATRIFCSVLLSSTACSFDTTPYGFNTGGAGAASVATRVLSQTAGTGAAGRAGQTTSVAPAPAGSASVSPAVSVAGAPANAGIAAGSGVVTAAVNTSRRAASGYVNLAPALDRALDGKGTTPAPASTPEGWVWYEIPGALCRDGSATGFYVHTGTQHKLMIYLEGGGACVNANFCNYNPATVDSALAGNGQTVVGTALGTVRDRQRPGIYASADHRGAPAGMFDRQNEKNPFKDWSQVYIPYCTGDLHFGTKRDVSIPGLDKQQFVGYLNMRLFMAKLVPTFSADLEQVLLTGASSGSAGAALNLSMVQDSFGDVPVDLIADSGVPLDDTYMPVCMQKRWREDWGFDDALPPDCTECRQNNGGGLLKLTDFLMRKYPSMHIGIVTRTQDEVMRMFFSVGNNFCATYDSADPLGLTLGQIGSPNFLFPADVYAEGLNDLRAQYLPTGRLATFLISTPNPNYHQHLFRDSFYETLNGSSVAQWASAFSAGKIEQVGP